MEQNKTGKYIKYAIGEILLVVIGILIALSINNWNEDRKRNELEKFYLSSIIEELEINVDIYNSIIPNLHKRMASIEHFFEIVNNNNSTKEDVELATDSVITFVGITFFRTTVFKELNQSGDFKVFNPELRKLISEHYNDLGNMEGMINRSLEEILEVRGEWHSSIDHAYATNLKSTENANVINWKTNFESVQFMKSTNFYTKRYFMMKRTERILLQEIEKTNKLIDQLKGRLSN